MLPSGKARAPKSVFDMLLPVANVTLVRLLQPSKAPHPILVTPLGMVTLVRLSQPVKA